MEHAQIDLAMVFAAAVLYMVIGYLWYSKWLFGPAVMKLHNEGGGKDLNSASLIYGFIIALVVSYFLAFFQHQMNVSTVSDGVFVGFTAWLGFVVTTQATGLIWGKHSFRGFFIHTTCKLVTFLAIGAVLAS